MYGKKHVLIHKCVQSLSHKSADHEMEIKRYGMGLDQGQGDKENRRQGFGYQRQAVC